MSACTVDQPDSQVTRFSDIAADFQANPDSYVGKEFIIESPISASADATSALLWISFSIRYTNISVTLADSSSNRLECIHHGERGGPICELFGYYNKTNLTIGQSVQVYGYPNEPATMGLYELRGTFGKNEVGYYQFVILEYKEK